jgi:hypothetical protein
MDIVVAVAVDKAAAVLVELNTDRVVGPEDREGRSSVYFHQWLLR